MSFFSSISLQNWRQFSHIQLDLSDQVTVLTGSNGCGKTTILSLLSQHFGWSIPLASTPYVSKRSAKKLYRDVRDKPRNDTESLQSDEDQNTQVVIGEIGYEQSGLCQITVPKYVEANYNVAIPGRRNLRGIFIPSHRQQSVYNPVSQIPTSPISATQIYEQYRSIAAQLYQSGGRVNKNPGAVQ